MSFVQRFCATGAAFAAVIAVGAFSSSSAQAAIITGTITGTWDVSSGSSPDIAVGDPFTATYAYDDATFHFYPPALDADLLSLTVTSGSYSHTFDSGVIGFTRSDAGGRNSSYYGYGITGFDNDNLTQLKHTFNADYTLETTYDGFMNEYSFAQLFVLDSQFHYDLYVQTNKVSFTPVPPTPAGPVPTPALLLGLIGMGAMALRKRKAKAAELASEA